MTTRQFRTIESYDAERVTRDMLADYLRARGFHDVDDQRRRHGRNVSQLITATTPWGAAVAMRVRLCWRRGRDASRGPWPYSAVQLLAKIQGGNWEGSLRAKVDREADLGVTHFLLVQREDDRIPYAALIPLSAVLPIWCAQRDTSARLIKEGKLGRKTKNHAMNGSSPTLYLQDDSAPEVAAALWDYPGVQDIALTPRLHSADSSRRAGAGFGSAAENRLVEAAAINLVWKQYEDNGWAVRSVERERCGYDLECRKGDVVENVEVKGVRGSAQVFVLTAGEVAKARSDPRFILVVVTKAISGTPALARYTGTAFLQAFDLSALQYRAAHRS